MSVQSYLSDWADIEIVAPVESWDNTLKMGGLVSVSTLAMFARNENSCYGEILVHFKNIYSGEKQVIDCGHSKHQWRYIHLISLTIILNSSKAEGCSIYSIKNVIFTFVP